MPQLSKDVIAFIMVPAWIKGPKSDLIEKMKNEGKVHSKSAVKSCPYVTHELMEPEHDSIMNQLRRLGFCNSENERVKTIFVPSYLNGDDGIFNMSYYDLLIGMDLTVFPSYYEPWGYTPHESLAFSVPTITSTLAGFGTWVKKMGEVPGLSDGVDVVFRDDFNHVDAAQEIAEIIFDFSLKSVEQIKMLCDSANSLSDKADWAHFIGHYQEAYCKALHNSFLRLSKPYKLRNE